MLCPYCGKDLEDGVFCDCPEAQEELAQEAEAALSEEQIDQEGSIDMSSVLGDTSERVSTFFYNAKGLLDSGSKKAKDVVAKGSQKAQAYMQDAKKASTQARNSILIDPNETIVASLGNNYVQNVIGNRTVKSGFAILTERRVYYSGQTFLDKGRGASAITEECIIPIENISRTRFIYNQGIGWLWIGLILALYGGITALIQFMNGPDDILTFIGLGMFVVGIIFIIIYFVSRFTVFEISFSGGSLSFRVEWYSLEDVRAFQRQIHLVKDRADYNKLGGAN